MSKRVLIVNKFYYARGGDCVCTLNLEKLLNAQGWEVAVYAMKYPENLSSEWSSYFAEEISFSGGVGEKVRAAKRLLGYGDIKASFKKILEDFKPSIVHLQNIHSYLSPIIAKMAKDCGCRVVWTLHDYKLLCPSYSCLRDGKPCELCFTDKSNVIKYRCMKNSMVASVLGYMEAVKWNKDWLERYVDAFVCPSAFMAQKMAQGGFDKTKLHVICNFLDPIKLQVLKEQQAQREKTYLYIGRLSHEKGVGTLLEVAKTLPFKLKIAGGGPLSEQFKEEYKGYGQIEFLGHQNAEQVSKLLSQATFAVVPSEWYENNPLSVIESLCAGTPVVGANIGGIPELIDNGDTGYIFESENSAQLRECIENAFSQQWDYDKIKMLSLCRFSQEKHYALLEKVYGQQLIVE